MEQAHAAERVRREEDLAPLLHDDVSQRRAAGVEVPYRYQPGIALSDYGAYCGEAGYDGHHLQH